MYCARKNPYKKSKNTEQIIYFYAAVRKEANEALPVKHRYTSANTSKTRSDRVYFHLFQLIVLMYHIIGPEEAQRQTLKQHLLINISECLSEHLISYWDLSQNNTYQNCEKILLTTEATKPVCHDQKQKWKRNNEELVIDEFFICLLKSESVCDMQVRSPIVFV